MAYTECSDSILGICPEHIIPSGTETELPMENFDHALACILLINKDGSGKLLENRQPFKQWAASFGFASVE